nr:leader peptide SpeFL [Pasteurella multocida]
MLIHDYYKEYHPDKGRSIMAHIRRTRHIMMPSYRSCFFLFNLQFPNILISLRSLSVASRTILHPFVQASCYFLNITWRLRIYYYFLMLFCCI